MAIAAFNRCTLFVYAAAALLAGCGVTPPPIGTLGAPTDSAGALSRSLETQPLVYIADGDKVYIVPERPHNAPTIGRITDGVSSAQGLWVDRHGSLYVANGSAGTITVYARGALTPSITYTGLPGPKYVVVGHAGNVFVSNSDGTVTEFFPGVTTAYRTWKTPGTQADGVDLDAQGNLYVAYRDTNNGYGSIEKFNPRSPSERGEVLGMPVNQPQGLVRTSSGAFLVVATGRPESVDVFFPGARQPNLILSVPDIPTELSITSDERKLFVIGWFGVYVTPYRRLMQRSNVLPVSVFHTKIGLRKYPGGVAGMALSNGQSF